MFNYCFRPRPTITIGSDEYTRLLKQEIQLIKYKETCQAKAVEVKRLQTQLAYFKKQISMLRKNQKDEHDDSDNKKISKVMPL